MRAEDLFEAMGALDEQLIALSEEDARRAREAESGRARQGADKRKAKRKKRAEIYRFAAVAMTTAAAVFIVLTARDLLGARSRGMSGNATASSEYSLEESAAEEAAQDTLAGGALGIEADEAAEQDAGTLSKYSVAQDPDAAVKEVSPEAAREDALAEEAAGDRESKVPAAKQSGTEAAESDAQEDAGNEDLSAPGAEPAPEAPAPNRAVDAGEAAQPAGDAGEAVQPGEDAGRAVQPAEEAAEAEGKTAVDMLGDLKGDYVKLEIITAEDKANGGARTVPEYSEEKERALTAALEDGQKLPTMFVRIGHPVGYVYLTDSAGKEDIVTFYENGYVGINTIPSFVMKLSDKAFEDVMEMFR